MIEVTLYVPVSDNNGKKFSTQHVDRFESFAVKLLGGLTRIGTVDGMWVDEGRVYTDHSVAYTFALTSITDGSKVAELTAYANRHFRQKAVYIRYLGLSEIL